MCFTLYGLGLSLVCKLILNEGFLWSGCCVCKHKLNLVVFHRKFSSCVFTLNLCTWFLQWYVIFYIFLLPCFLPSLLHCIYFFNKIALEHQVSWSWWTLMVKLLINSVIEHMPQNKVSDTKYHQRWGMVNNLLG